MESAQVIIHQPKPTVEESTPADEADGDRPVPSSVGRDGSAKVTNAPHQPMGVRQLARCDVLKVHQHLDCVEVCFGFERTNRYSVYDETGDQILYIYEVSDCYARQCSGSFRFFLLKAQDQNQEEVFWVRRPIRCSSRCLWACCNLQEMDLLTPGFMAPTGHIKEVWSCCIPQFTLTNNNEAPVYNITGECQHFRCCCDILFQVTDTNGEIVATIEKPTKGCREICGAYNDFTLTFSEGLGVKDKINILGAVFLVDFNYFEKHGRC